MSDTKQIDVPLPFPEEKIVRRGGNGGGDDMLEKLEKRVERLETDVSQIKIELTKLTTRSEEFVTKGDLHKEIVGQTRWIAGTILVAVGLCMTIAKFMFG